MVFSFWGCVYSKTYKIVNTSCYLSVITEKVTEADQEFLQNNVFIQLQPSFTFQSIAQPEKKHSALLKA